MGAAELSLGQGRAGGARGLVLEERSCVLGSREQVMCAGQAGDPNACSMGAADFKIQGRRDSSPGIRGKSTLRKERLQKPGSLGWGAC